MPEVTRREFLAVSAVAASSVACATAANPGARSRPNVLLILTDDQGYGDLGCHGNPHVKTPHLDRLYAESLRLTNYHNCPVCTPTRASLMTGRYNYRTCAIDTYRGRAMMHPEEVTLAELLAAGGYHTGIFGKWHLGDCFPMRACDQGFHESLVHHGGGLRQPSDPPESGGYFDPVLMKNGERRRYEGYCTDIFGNAAIEFLEQNREEPFFLYFATNAPHTPLIVDEAYAAPYRAMGLSDSVSKLYGMITNLDENVGRLLDTVDRLGLRDNTIVIFMTDNGAQMGQDAQRFNAGMRGQKATIYEGGIRVPCFIRWPGVTAPGADDDRLRAHIDIMPTLLEACGVAVPGDLRLDGRSLMPILRGAPAEWSERTLFFQWHRGDVPEPYNGCACLTDQYKLVNGVELYDLRKDPAEERDVSSDHPDVVAKLRAEYEAWFADVGSTRGYDPPRIVLGDARANPVYLTLQDQRAGEGGGYGLGGYWAVHVVRAGDYEITCRYAPEAMGGHASVQVGGVTATTTTVAGDQVARFASVRLPSGPASVRAWIATDGPPQGARYVDIRALA